MTGHKQTHCARQENTTLTVTVTPTYESAGDQERGAKGERLFLMVEVHAGSDMPVMDSALAGGKCDPFCKVPRSSVPGSSAICTYCSAFLSSAFLFGGRGPGESWQSIRSCV